MCSFFNISISDFMVYFNYMYILILIAGMFFRIEPNPELWEGKRGACIGALYSIISERNIGVPAGGIMEICALLRDSLNPQAESIVRVIRRFASDY